MSISSPLPLSPQPIPEQFNLHFRRLNCSTANFLGLLCKCTFVQTVLANSDVDAYECTRILSKMDLNLWGITVFRALTAVSFATLLRVTILREFTVLAYSGV